MSSTEKRKRKDPESPRIKSVKNLNALIYPANKFTNEGGRLKITHPPLVNLNLKYKGDLHRNKAQPWHFNQNGIVILHNPHKHEVQGPNVSITRIPNNYHESRAINNKRGSKERQDRFNKTYYNAKKAMGDKKGPLDCIITTIPAGHVMLVPPCLFHRGPVRAQRNALSAYKAKPSANCNYDGKCRAICEAFRPKIVPNLSHLAAVALIQAGVTNKKLEDMGYPNKIVSVVKNARTRTRGQERK